MAELAKILSTSNHSGLIKALHSSLLPCLTTSLSLLHQSKQPERTTEATEPASLLQAEPTQRFDLRGKAWAMLGMLRLHLAAPPAGADPAGKFVLKAAHLERVLTQNVSPEAQVYMLLDSQCTQCTYRREQPCEGHASDHHCCQIAETAEVGDNTTKVREAMFDVDLRSRPH